MKTNTSTEPQTRIAFLNTAKLKRTQIKRLISQCVPTNYGLQYCEYKDQIFYMATFHNTSDAEKVYEAYDGLELENTGVYLDLRYLNHNNYNYVEEESDDEEMEDMINRAFCSYEELDDELAHALIDLSDENVEDDGHVKQIQNNVSKPVCVKIEKNTADIKSHSGSEEEILEDNEVQFIANRKKEVTWKDRKKKKIEKRIKERAENDFTPDLQDERFAAVYENNDYNIDITNYAYKSNQSLKDLVREKRNRRSK